MVSWVKLSHGNLTFIKKTAVIEPKQGNNVVSQIRKTIFILLAATTICCALNYVSIIYQTINCATQAVY